jgi:DNA-binding MarR family transcriptional regulator
MEQPDAVIHQPIRLKIMAALKTMPRGERLEFVRLKAIVQTTEGNLGAHIASLESAGYIKIEKDFNGKKPRTRVSLSQAGLRAFERYVAFLRDILNAETTSSPSLSD